jgi:hypothetical protein
VSLEILLGDHVSFAGHERHVLNLAEDHPINGSAEEVQLCPRALCVLLNLLPKLKISLVVIWGLVDLGLEC